MNNVDQNQINKLYNAKLRWTTRAFCMRRSYEQLTPYRNQTLEPILAALAARIEAAEMMWEVAHQRWCVAMDAMDEQTGMEARVE